MKNAVVRFLETGLFDFTYQKEVTMVAVEQSKIFVGLGGWEFGAFDKIFYPPKVKKGFHKLEHYSRLFDNVEINATFYSTAFAPEHSRRWLENVAANKNFIFTVKLFRGFTHTFDATNDDVRSVRNLLEPLAEVRKIRRTRDAVSAFFHQYAGASKISPAV